MAFDFHDIESRIRVDFPCHPDSIWDIFKEVREAVSAHIFLHKLRPRDTFQMRLAAQDEYLRNVPPEEQTYLIIHFGEKILDDDYLNHLRSYYWKVFFFHIYLNHSLIL